MMLLLLAVAALCLQYPVQATPARCNRNLKDINIPGMTVKWVYSPDPHWCSKECMTTDLCSTFTWERSTVCRLRAEFQPKPAEPERDVGKYSRVMCQPGKTPNVKCGERQYRIAYAAPSKLKPKAILKVIPGSRDWAWCKKECVKVKKCKGYTFYYKRGSNPSRCVLLGSLSHGSRMSGKSESMLLCGRGESEDLPCDTELPGMRYDTHVIKRHMDAEKSWCFKECANYAGCVAATFITDRKECRFLSKAAYRHYDPKAITKEMCSSETSECDLLLTDTEVVGGTMGPYDGATTTAECEAKCRATEKCRGFVFYSRKSSYKCWLKYMMNGRRRTGRRAKGIFSMELCKDE